MTAGTSTTWIDDVESWLRVEPVVRVVVIRAEGSAPREAGAAMLVGTASTSGTIGGGALEYQAIAQARVLRAAGSGAWLREIRDYPLGPALNQCCGGFVTLLYERYLPQDATLLESIADNMRFGLIVHSLVSGEPLIFVRDRKARAALPIGVLGAVRAMLSGTRRTEPLLIDGGAFVEPVMLPRTPLFLYGAGHVGRAVVRVLDGLAIDLTWIDTDRARFPDVLPAHVRIIVAGNPERLAAKAPADAMHLVMTYSHDLDERICGAVVSGEFAFLGLIGSKTKRARFVQRLRRAGIAEATLARLVSPIGIDGIAGKAPEMIAISVAAQIAQLLSRSAQSTGVGTQQAAV